MHFFIDFWKLETENSILHVFSFLHKLNFENSFCFLPILSCQTSFSVLKIENCFWKQKIREKNSYQTYPNILKSYISSFKDEKNLNQTFVNLIKWEDPGWKLKLVTRHMVIEKLELHIYCFGFGLLSVFF